MLEAHAGGSQATRFELIPHCHTVELRKAFGDVTSPGCRGILRAMGTPAVVRFGSVDRRVRNSKGLAARTGEARDVLLRVNICASDVEDLGSLADQWGLSVSATAWALIRGWIAQARGETAELGPHRAAIAAALARLTLAERSAGAADAASDPDTNR